MDSSDSESGNEVDDILGPEDLFNDEADEDNVSAKEDEAEENPVESEDTSEAKVKIEEKPKLKPKRVVRNPRVVLNYESLSKPSGLPALKKLFTDFKFKGNGHEKEDLIRIMGILQQWMCYQLCPSYDFESCMLQLEALGQKKAVQTLMKKYRLGIDDWGEVKSDNEDDNEKNDGTETSQLAAESEFDLFLNEELAKVISEDELSPACGEVDIQENTQKEAEVTLTAEQLERIERNRKLAVERRMKRMSQQQSTTNEESLPVGNSEIEPMELCDNT